MGQTTLVLRLTAGAQGEGQAQGYSSGWHSVWLSNDLSNTAGVRVRGEQEGVKQFRGTTSPPLQMKANVSLRQVVA
jgi:hypothetical protein